MAIGSIKQIAKSFPGLAETAIRRGVLSGEIRSAKSGNKYIVTDEAVRAWLLGSDQAGRSEGMMQGVRRVGR